MCYRPDEFAPKGLENNGGIKDGPVEGVLSEWRKYAGTGKIPEEGSAESSRSRVGTDRRREVLCSEKSRHGELGKYVEAIRHHVSLDIKSSVGTLSVNQRCWLSH